MKRRHHVQVSRGAGYGVVAWVWLSGVSLACTVPEEQVDVSMQLEKAPVAFVGVVKNATYPAPVTFSVIKAIKGPSEGQDYVVKEDYTSCSMDMSAGETWLFLGSRIGSGSRLLKTKEGHLFDKEAAFVKQQFSFDVEADK